MSRALAAAGWSYVALCGLILASSRKPPLTGEPPSPAPAYAGKAGSWFARIKPFCNAVEVEVQQQQLPPPAGADGAGYAAACYALAGKIDRARQAIDALPSRQRPAAAGIVFQVGHPVADAGDDASAGPIMRLVVEYQPDNYMALYHAGVSEYMLGQLDYARTHLEKFLQLYTPEDGWRANAREVLGRISSR
jgi:tetratricopeptide (TPR) repeat protein